MLSLNKALVKTKFEHDLCDAAFDNLNVKIGCVLTILLILYVN